MKNNEFRQAVELLYPDSSFRFEAGERMYAAHGEFEDSHVSLVARKDSIYISVYMNNIPSEVHDVYEVLEELGPSDPFTAEQNQLEQARAFLKEMRGTLLSLPNADNTDYVNGLLTGKMMERELLISTLEDILGVN